MTVKSATNRSTNMPEEVAVKTDEVNGLVASELEDKPSPDKIMDSKKKEVVINPPVLLSSRRRRSSSARTSVKQKEPEVVARRNARERRRVKLVNDGFLRLRKHVPTDPKNKKLSKVKTLRSAIEYIRHLQQLLNQATKNTNIPLADVTKFEVLQGATVNGSQTWFSSLDLHKKDAQDYKEFEDAFFAPSRILPRAPLQSL